ncbi:MAG TPA: hypothetical protein VHD32_06445 [Candidatus Didemnitutus sp.]|nr:hypothetical protein [Candidatus Didemnitutus sp.]
MKRLFVLFCVLAATAWADTPSFWSQLTPEERKAAGIDQLTPEQQAALDRLVQKSSQEGTRHEVEAAKAQAQAETAAAVEKAREEARVEAKKEAAVAAKKAREEAKAEAKEEARKKKAAGAGLVVREDDEVIHTRILGRFKGWDGHTVFHLENGQVWEQSSPDIKYFPHLVDPEVALEPHSWAGWRLVIVSEGLWCKVKRVQ